MKLIASIKEYLTSGNVATTLILLIVAVGAVKVAIGDLSIAQLTNLMDVPVVGLALGAGAAKIQFNKAVPGESLVPMVTLLVVVAAIAGALSCIFGSLTFEAFVKTIQLPVAGLAVGRGIAANNQEPPAKV
jgi:hypothetical protein